MKILIAPNSFKECADAVVIAGLIQKACAQRFPHSIVQAQPVSDGGDGFLKVITLTKKLEVSHFRILDCYNQSQISAPYGYDRANGDVFLESADIFGMKTVIGQKKKIEIASSRGLGIVLKKLVRKLGAENIRRIVIGLGGSAINDFGLGLLYELGGKFDGDKQLQYPYLPKNFGNLQKIAKAEEVFPIPIETVTDVQIPLFGKSGCSRVFAKQKGASDSQIEFLEKHGRRIARLLERQLHEKVKNINGACGGVSLGLHACAKVTEVPASKFLREYLHLEDQVRAADVIITGEGRFDAQSLMKKATGLVIESARRNNKQVVMICGSVDSSLRKRMQGVTQVIELERFYQSKYEAMQNIKKGIKLAVKDLNL